MDTTSILDASGRTLQSRVDVADGQIILHSRSGGGLSGRNPDYRLALVEILTRLTSYGMDFSVYLDSAAAIRERPELENRFLISSIQLTKGADDGASQIISLSNAGSRSKGAWRRLLIAVPGGSSNQITTLLGGSGTELPPISASDLDLVGRYHVEAAIREIREGRERPNRFDEGSKYRLIVGDGGPDLPLEKVFGIALAITLERRVEPSDFSSGEKIFGILLGHDFRVVQRVERLSGVEEEGAPFHHDPEELPLCDEELNAIEGDRRLRCHLRIERSRSLPRSFKAEFIRLNGRLLCERCGKDYVAEYGETLAASCFDVHHTTPLSDRDEAATTRADQLQLLCANCHRITHREMSNLSFD